MGKRKKQISSAESLEQAADFFHLDWDGFPAWITVPEEQLRYLHEETPLILSPITLDGDWRRTTVGPIIAQNQEGDFQVLLPDRR